jgi:hypothetical protein
LAGLPLLLAFMSKEGLFKIILGEDFRVTDPAGRKNARPARGPASSAAVAASETFVLSTAPLLHAPMQAMPTHDAADNRICLYIGAPCCGPEDYGS